jgi:hypothetical protein
MDYRAALPLLFLKSFEEAENNLGAETAYNATTTGPTTAFSLATCSLPHLQRLPGRENCGKMGTRKRGNERAGAICRIVPYSSNESAGRMKVGDVEQLLESD